MPDPSVIAPWLRHHGIGEGFKHPISCCTWALIFHPSVVASSAPPILLQHKEGMACPDSHAPGPRRGGIVDSRWCSSIDAEASTMHSTLYGICLVFCLLPGLRQSGELGGCTSGLPGLNSLTSNFGLPGVIHLLFSGHPMPFSFSISATLPYNCYLLVVAAVLSRSEYLALVLKGIACPRLVLLSPVLHHSFPYRVCTILAYRQPTRQPRPRRAAN